MENKDYEQKKQKCWEEFWDEISGNMDFAPGVNERMKEHIYDTFDRAYAIGRQTETISQEEIETAALEYSEHLGKNRDVTWNDAEYGFLAGAQFALGKQKKDADAVIQGWVCRDNNSLNAQVLIGDKPKRTGYNYWENKSADCITLPKDSFPDLTWESDPIEVELIIKRKKK